MVTLKNYFEGYYYKHQKDGQTIAFIPGINNNKEFIQIITNDASYHIPYIGNNHFSKNGISIDINYQNLKINGEIQYADLTPIKYDIMGIFKYLPMECRHGVVSMYHNLTGFLIFCGKTLDFTHGIGYIEKDSGTSFPKSYLWIQCNAFEKPCSIMVSVADIPFMGFSFTGVICVVWHEGKEYRLATYLGVKILRCGQNGVTLQQGKYRLEVTVLGREGQKLFAPKHGEMTRVIKESNATKARFRFYESDKLVFDLQSDYASFEFI